MRAAVPGSYKVCEAAGILGIVIGVLKGACHLDSAALPFEFHRLHEHIAVFVKIVEEGDQPVFIAIGFRLRLLASGILYNKRNAGEKKGFFPCPFSHRGELEFGGGEDFGIRLEGDLRTGAVGIAELFELAHLLVAVIKPHPHELAVMGHFGNQPLGEGVDDRSTDAMEAAGGFIAAFAGELAAGVKHGKNHLQGVLSAWMGADRHAAAFILNRAGIVLIEGNGDFLSESVERLVYGVVYDFPDQVVKPVGIGGSDIHTRPFSDRIKTF